MGKQITEQIIFATIAVKMMESFTNDRERKYEIKERKNNITINISNKQKTHIINFFVTSLYITCILCILTEALTIKSYYSKMITIACSKS
ncbi:hypothetical protein T06_13972 [Trichinella sp. T6]|nr:hypothetical protein T06_13972 [Trichinella sp. T6]